MDLATTHNLIPRWTFLHFPGPGCKNKKNSLAQSRPFDLLVFPFWFIFSKGPKRLTFYFQVLWASEKRQTKTAPMIPAGLPQSLSSCQPQLRVQRAQVPRGRAGEPLSARRHGAEKNAARGVRAELRYLGGETSHPVP